MFSAISCKFATMLAQIYYFFIYNLSRISSTKSDFLLVLKSFEKTIVVHINRPVSSWSGDSDFIEPKVSLSLYHKSSAAVQRPTVEDKLENFMNNRFVLLTGVKFTTD